MNRSTAVTAFAAIALAGVGVASPPAVAADGEVRKDGACSASSDWKLKAKPDNGRLEVEGEVDSNKVGQTWNWRILHNGTVVKRGSATTVGPSGSFEVRRRIPNSAGVDRVGWRAANPATGETCRGSLQI